MSNSQRPVPVAYTDAFNNDSEVSAANPLPVTLGTPSSPLPVTFTAQGGGTVTKLQNVANVAGAGAQFAWPGGPGEFVAVATAWNGATCTLQKLGPDGATWVPVGADTTVAANGMAIFNCAPGMLQAVISNANPTALTASVTPVTTA